MLNLLFKSLNKSLNIYHHLDTNMQKLLEGSNLIVFLFNDYEKKVIELLEVLKEKKLKVCYVLLRTPYKYFISDLKQNNLYSNDFFFIDVLSSHYVKQKNSKNCIYLDYPEVDALVETAKEQFSEKKCQVLLFDSISSLLKYQPNYRIQNLINKLKKDLLDNLKILMLMPKKEEILIKESSYLLKDLEMYADSVHLIQ